MLTGHRAHSGLHEKTAPPSHVPARPRRGGRTDRAESAAHESTSSPNNPLFLSDANLLPAGREGLMNLLFNWPRQLIVFSCHFADAPGSAGPRRCLIGET